MASPVASPGSEDMLPQELMRQFQDYERDIRVRNYRMTALLAAFFMVAGSVLDYVVYDVEGVMAFLHLRVMSAVVLLIIRGLLGTEMGRMWHRLLGLGMATPLVGTIAWMIFERQGAASPYYAGLNLIMLGAAILMRWPLLDSIFVVIMTMLMYLAASFGHGPVMESMRSFLNNLYFLFVTGVFVSTGTWYYNSTRLTEFKLRQGLNRSNDELHTAKARLEESFRDLETSKSELEVSNARLEESFRDLETSKSELEVSNARLEDSFRELETSKSELEVTNAKLEENNQKLRELDEAKSRFFANVSHELRTPLTLLIAPIESMRNRGDRLSATEKDDLLATMQGNAMRLLKLINDLLALVRMESGAIQIRRAPVALDEFVRGLGNSAASMAKDKRIHLNVTCAPELGRVMADSEKLERICLNLMFNALKFTPTGGTVDVSAQRDGEWIRLQVRDTGVGISKEDQEKIFMRFWQADTSSQRKFQGMGIGLSLVKEIAEAHGGSVAVESEPGHGTTMTVLLPYEEAPEITPEAQAAAKAGEMEPVAEKEWIGELYRRAEMFPSMTSLQASLRPVEVGLSKRSKKPRLLIADDEPDMLRFLRTQLSESYEIIEAVDGHQAVEKAAQFLPDMILSDMMMPEKDGLQVCRELRERTPTKSIPIVLLTARADEETKIACLTAGASDFLGKPFTLAELSVRLKNLTDAHLYQKELASQKQRLEAALEQIKETEAMLVRNEKLASLGRLSAGLIHEINNPLNYAKQALYFLRSTTEKLAEADRPEFEETLGDIENGIDRVARIISDLRGFSRNSSQIAGSYNLGQAVETTLRFFSHAFKEGVEVQADLPAYIELAGDQNQVIQVLINLIQNSLDAMSEKTYPDGEQRQLRLWVEQTDFMVALHVRDNGPGIPETIQNNVFDPFFTTKDVGAGMGLGLSICHQIIAEHGGRILLESTPGEFCEFILEFPISAPILED